MTQIELNELNYQELKALSVDVEREIKAREKDLKKEARQAVLSAAKEFGLSIEEIFGVDAKRTYNTAPKKYRNPENHDEVWTGRGKQPTWFVHLTHARGVPVEQLLIENQEAKDNQQPSSPPQFYVPAATLPQQNYQVGA